MVITIIACASLKETAEMFGACRNTVSNVMTVLTKEGKTSSSKLNFWRKSKCSDTYCRTFTGTIREDHKSTVLDVTRELNGHFKIKCLQKVYLPGSEWRCISQEDYYLKNAPLKIKNHSKVFKKGVKTNRFGP